MKSTLETSTKGGKKMQNAMKTKPKKQIMGAYINIYSRMTGGKIKGDRIEVDWEENRTQHKEEKDMLDPWRASVTYIKINIPDRPGENKLTMVMNWQNHDDTAIKTLKIAQQKVHKSKASSYEKHIMTKFITKKYKKQ